VTLKEKYADQPLYLRDKLMLVDLRAFMNGMITEYELEEVRFPLDKGKPPKRSWWQRLLRRAK
jgi:hypothetical protein